MWLHSAPSSFGAVTAAFGEKTQNRNMAANKSRQRLSVGDPHFPNNPESIFFCPGNTTSATRQVTWQGEASFAHALQSPATMEEWRVQSHPQCLSGRGWKSSFGRLSALPRMGIKQKPELQGAESKRGFTAVTALHQFPTTSSAVCLDMHSKGQILPLVRKEVPSLKAKEGISPRSHRISLQQSRAARAQASAIAWATQPSRAP